MKDRAAIIATAARRIERRVIPIDGCWYWPGGKQRRGYGSIRVPEFKRNEYTHRIMYEAYRGEIPENLQIDHLCSNTMCCNPHHLEAVTASENTRRSYERNRMFTANTPKLLLVEGGRNG